MKRTIGKPTYAFEARDYVVSLPVTARSCGHGTGTNPCDSTKTGDLGALWLRQREKPPCTHPATGFLIPESRMEKGAKLSRNKLPKNVSELSLCFSPLRRQGLLSELVSLSTILRQNLTPKTPLVTGEWHSRRRPRVAPLPTCTSETDGSVKDNQKKKKNQRCLSKGHRAVKWPSVDFRPQTLTYSCSLSPFSVLEVSTCDGPITHGPASSVCPHVLLTLVAPQAP